MIIILQLCQSNIIISFISFISFTYSFYPLVLPSIYYFREKRKSPAAHPRTPDPYQDTSKRAFDGQIKAWRRSLHKWDNPDIRPDLIAYEEYKSRQNKMDCETTDNQQPQGSIVGQKRNQTEELSGQPKKTKLNDSQTHKETKNSSNSGGNKTKDQEEIDEQEKKKNSLLIGEELEEVDYHSDHEEWNEYDEEDVL